MASYHHHNPLSLRKQRHGLLLALILTVLMLGGTPSAAIFTTLPAYEVLRMEDLILPGHMLTFQFNFPSDISGPLPVRVSRDGVVEEEWSDAWDGVVTITVPSSSKKPAVIVVEIDNSASRFTKSAINFFFRRAIDFSHTASQDMLDPVEKKVSALTSAMQHMETLQASLRIEQKNHRCTVEDAINRVMTWSVVQVLALILLMVFNFLYLRRFLERKSFL